MSNFADMNIFNSIFHLSFNIQVVYRTCLRKHQPLNYSKFVIYSCYYFGSGRNNSWNREITFLAVLLVIILLSYELWYFIFDLTGSLGEDCLNANILVSFNCGFMLSSHFLFTVVQPFYSCWGRDDDFAFYLKLKGDSHLWCKLLLHILKPSFET